MWNYLSLVQPQDLASGLPKGSPFPKSWGLAREKSIPPSSGMGLP
jgi:hypothetical protein